MDIRYQILGALASLALAVITAATPLVVRAILRYLESKLAIDLSTAQEEAIERGARQAVEYVEEQARAQLVKYGVTTPPADKMALARAFLESVLERQGHELVQGSGTEALLNAAIEAAVHAQRTRPKEPIVERQLTIDQPFRDPPTR